MPKETALAKLEKVPVHVAMIMDGNGRWAKSRGLPRLAGHRAGTENLRRIIRACVEFGVQHLTLYAFSTENWDRPRDEVEGLLTILEEVIDRELVELNEEGVKLDHIGHLDQLPPKSRAKVEEAMALTKDNSRLYLHLAFSYGGRDELVHAMRRIVEESIAPENITEEVISQHLFTAGTPDPDLIIRTSGELRSSNFLIWQGAYSEWIFPAVYWPEFDRVEFHKTLQEFAKRDRRFGRIK